MRVIDLVPSGRSYGSSNKSLLPYFLVPAGRPFYKGNYLKNKVVPLGLSISESFIFTIRPSRWAMSLS